MSTNIKSNNEAIEQIVSDYFSGNESESDQIIEKLMKGNQAAKFKKLYEDGDISDYDNDDSKADFALVKMITSQTSDKKLIEEIFNKSKLGKRKKWTSRKDYRQRTIKNALKKHKKLLIKARDYVTDWGQKQKLFKVTDDFSVKWMNKANQTIAYQTLILDYEEYLKCNNIKYKYQIGKSELNAALTEYFRKLNLKNLEYYNKKLKYDNSSTDEELKAFLTACSNEAREEDVAALKQTIWQVKRKMNNLPVKDHLLVNLQGRSGAGKSVAINKLFSCIPRNLIMEMNGTMFNDERCYPSFSEYYVGLLDELDKVGKARVEALKNIISADYKQARPMRTNETRQYKQNLTFVSTSNYSIFKVVKDSTSSRRYWDIKTADKLNWGSINKIDYLKIWKSVDENNDDGYLKGKIGPKIKAIQDKLRYRDSAYLFIQEEVEQSDNDEDYVTVQNLYNQYVTFCDDGGYSKQRKDNFADNVRDYFSHFRYCESRKSYNGDTTRAKRFEKMKLVRS